ncbi:hypothetical protein BTHI11S_05966 [Bosea thiooxidans]
MASSRSRPAPAWSRPIELFDRHFQWEKKPTPASERQITAYKLDRALRAQGLVSLNSACHLDAPSKKAVAELIAAHVRRKELVPVAVEGAGKTQHWAMPASLETPEAPEETLIHILSPFDPLMIQRKRAKLFFDYAHVFEAYLPKEKRTYGYFGLPVLAGDRIVAVLDLKTDRAAGRLLMQQWAGSAARKRRRSRPRSRRSCNASSASSSAVTKPSRSRCR